MNPNQIALPRIRDRIEFATTLGCLRKRERDREIAKLGAKGLLEKGLIAREPSLKIGIVRSIDKVVESPVEDRYFCTVNYGWQAGNEIAWIDIPKIENRLSNLMTDIVIAD